MRDMFGTVVCGKGECAKDVHGIVYCSKYRNGGATRDLLSPVVCGKGKCIKSPSGIIYCSRVEGGWVKIDSQGRVVCEGGCERASSSMCEKAK